MTINFHDLYKAVQTLATNEPDHKYGHAGNAPLSCSYRGESKQTPNVGRGCIFGEAFKSLGVDDGTLYVYDSYGPIGTVLTYIDVDNCYADDRMWANSVQSFQDSGHTWGEAVQFANDTFPAVRDRHNAHA